MTAEEALALLERVLDSDYLSQTQIAVFRKVWEGQSYVEIAIATGYDHGYIKDTGAQIWRLLSRVLDKKVTKSNVRNIISGLSSQLATTQAVSGSCPPSCSRQSWGEAMDVSTFYGRETEQAALKSWIDNERCRLIGLFGIGGVGKTALSVKLAQRVQAQFDFVIWRSLRLAPPLVELLPELILVLSEQQDTQVLDTAPKQIEHLFTYLRQHRCLLVLDNWESILQSGERAGRYRRGYENYGYLLERIADERHQSCLLITSREKPRGMAQREGDGSPVRSLQLSGLDQSSSQEIIRRAGFDSQSQQHECLVERYGGNPLALRIVAATIRSVFGGDVADFLAYGTVVFGDLWDLLDQQFRRLSAIEQTVMRWLAINREWTSLKELRADIIPPVAHRALLEAVESLKARSLVETSAAGITQQPVVMEYMTERLISQFYEEINQREFDLFSQVALLKADAKEFVREAQMRQLSRILLERLLKDGEEPAAIAQQLQQQLSGLRYKPAREVGYAGGNLLNLLCQLEVDLQGQDLSHLTIWQAYLSGKNLQNVNLTAADLSKSVFSESLGSAITVAFSPDDQFLAAGDTNGEIHLWTVSDSRKHLSWKAHAGWVWSVVFSPDGQRLASCSEDKTIKIWDVTTGQLCQTLVGHQLRSRAVAWYADGQRLVSGSEDQTIKIWDLVTNTCLKTLIGSGEAIEPVAISADGKIIASGSPVVGTIHLWSTDSGEHINSLTDHASGVRALTTDPITQNLISGSADKTVRVWDISTGQCLSVLQGHLGGIWSVATNDDGHLIASAGEDQTVRIWDAETGQCLRTLQGFTSRVWSIAFQTQSSILASCDDQSIKLWSVESGQCLKTFKGYPQVNWSVTFIPNTAALACGGQEQIVRIWDLETETCHRSLKGHSRYVHALTHHPVEPLLASAAGNTIYVWNLETHDLTKILEGHEGQIWQIAFSPDGQHLATSSFDHTARLWDWQTGTCLKTLRGHQGWVFGLSFSPDGRFLVTSSIDKSIKLWDTSTGQCLKSFQIDTDWMSELTFSPDGQTMVSGGSHGDLILWSLDADKPLRVVKGHGGHISAICFTPNGQTFVSSSHDHTIKLWDATTFECLKTLIGHENMVSSVAYSSDHKMLASASHDETVRVWDIDTLECLKVLRAPRPYKDMNIQSVSGLTDAQKSTLTILGAVQKPTDKQ